MMKMKITRRCACPRNLLHLSGLLLCLSVVGAGGWQIKGQQAVNKVAVRERIAALIRETLQQGEGNVDGVRLQTSVPPSTETIEEIKHYGDDAVLVLTDYLQSESVRERSLAIKLLGSLGGSRIVDPLQKVIRYDESPTIKQTALRSITQAPWELALPVVREAAETDPDSRVRAAARELLIKTP